jgi:hypothetical protein
MPAVVALCRLRKEMQPGQRRTRTCPAAVADWGHGVGTCSMEEGALSSRGWVGVCGSRGVRWGGVGRTGLCKCCNTVCVVQW